MTFDLALRLTGAALGFALAQQALEHMAARDRAERRLFAPRLILGALLAAGVAPLPVCLGLLAQALAALRRFDGPYNGGSDRMSFLCLICLTAAHGLPTQGGRELALAYLAAQLTLSYALAGWVKLVNPDWRSGVALCDVFRFSAYPVARNLRALADRPRLLAAAGWGVMLFEALFPLAFLHPGALAAALVCAAAFHLANAALFGLNRFFWAWLAAYPALIWLQGRLLG